MAEVGGGQEGAVLCSANVPRPFRAPPLFRCAERLTLLTAEMLACLLEYQFRWRQEGWVSDAV